MGRLIINGVAVTPPKTFTATIQDIDGETHRNANGDMVRDRVAVKRKLEMSWGMLTQSQMAQILNAVSNVFFSVEYPDPILGQRTSTFYVGDRSSPAYSFNEKLKPWSGLTLNLVER